MFYFTHLAIYRIPSKTLQQMKRLILTAVLTCTLGSVWAKEYHVSADAKAEGNGSFQSPFKTINSAAQVARAGDTITVYEGTYREWVDPKYGGTDPGNPILYRAANGETVQLKGSEIVKGWKKQKNGTWTITLPESFFGGYNALNTDVEGDWFWPYSKRNHTADIYVNGISMYETDSLHKVTKVPRSDVNERSYTWYTETNGGETTVWANFQDFNPNKELIEVSLRPTCFYPTQRGINYITLRGFDISQAASQWGAPTAHQVGMVATHWNKGWIIEENTIQSLRELLWAKTNRPDTTYGVRIKRKTDRCTTSKRSLKCLHCPIRGAKNIQALILYAIIRFIIASKPVFVEVWAVLLVKYMAIIFIIYGRSVSLTELKLRV